MSSDAATGRRRCPECGGYAFHREDCRTRPLLMAEDRPAAYVLVSILWDDFELHAVYAKSEDAEAAREEADAAQKRKLYKRHYYVEGVEFHA